VRCLLSELGANVSHGSVFGSTALFSAAYEGQSDVVRCLVREFGADINLSDYNGITPLMAASSRKHAALCKWLVKAGADPQAKAPNHEIAADISRRVGASPEQTAYLEANKCQGRMQGRYCGPACHVAHWPNHRAECQRLGAALKCAQDEGGEGEF
jgi:hypothetical protein